MSDSRGASQPGHVDLAELILSAKGSLSYRDLATKSGNRLTHGRWQQLATAQRQSVMPKPETLQIVAETLGLPLRMVVLAAARTVGLDVDSRPPRLADRLPLGVDDLSEVQAAALIQMARALVAQLPTATGLEAGDRPVTTASDWLWHQHHDENGEYFVMGIDNEPAGPDVQAGDEDGPDAGSAGGVNLRDQE